MSDRTSTPKTGRRVRQESTETKAQIASGTGPEVWDEENVTLDAAAADPFITACPPWCVTTPHTIASGDEDRYHAGEITVQPLRDLRAAYDSYGPDDCTYTLGHVETYLLHRVLHRDPQVHVDLNGTSAGLELTLDEAEVFARRLLTMVEAAR